MKTKKESKVKVSVGDNINVDIMQPNRGSFPIGRYNGIICKLEIPKSIKFVPYGCTCNCTVIEVKEKTYVVNVIEIIKSVAVNKLECDKKLEELREMNKKQKKEKVRRNYPYLSKQELNSGKHVESAE